MLDNKPYTFDRVFRIVVTIGVIMAVIWAFGALSEVLIPFAIAFLLAYLIDPLVCLVQKKIRHRMAAVVVTLLGLAVVVLLSGYVILQPVTTQVKDMKRIALKVGQSERVDRLRERVNAWGVVVLDKEQQKKILEQVKGEQHRDMLKKIAEKVFPFAKNAVGGVFKAGWALVMGLLGVTVILLYLVFILADYQSVRKDWKGLIPPKWKTPITEFIHEFDGIMNKHFRAQAIVAALVGVLFAIGFSLIGLPVAILLGLLIGALNMIPYLQIVGLVPAAGFAVMMAIDKESSISTALIMVAVVFLVVQVIQDAVLVPKIMGKVTGLKPAMILLSISIWGQLLGFLGLLIALPMTCLVLAYYHRFILKRSS